MFQKPILDFTLVFVNSKAVSHTCVCKQDIRSFNLKRKISKKELRVLQRMNNFFPSSANTMTYRAQHTETMHQSPGTTGGTWNRGAEVGTPLLLLAQCQITLLKRKGLCQIQNLSWFCFPSQRKAVSNNHNSTFYFSQKLFSYTMVLKPGYTLGSPGKILETFWFNGPMVLRIFLKVFHQIDYHCTQGWLLMLAIIRSAPHF